MSQQSLQPKFNPTTRPTAVIGGGTLGSRIALMLASSGGEVRLMDKVSLDVVLDIEEHYAAIRPGLPAGPRELLKKYISEGRLGVKTGRGFFDDYQQKTTAVA